MITNFWFIAVVLCAVAVGFILLPLFRSRVSTEPDNDRKQLNVELYRERMAELEQSLADGDVSAEQFAQLKLELGQNLLSETDLQVSNPGVANDQLPAGDSGRGLSKLVLTISAIVPLFAILAYSDYGLSWGAINDLELSKEFQSTNAHDDDGMRGSIIKLAKRLENQPENHDGWFLLGQSYMSLGEFEKSADAYRHLLDQFPQDPGLGAYYAEALYLADERTMTNRVSKAIAAALALNPQNITMLEIKAMNAFQTGDPGGAVTLFEQALASGAEGERARMIQQAISRLRSELGENAPAPLVTATAKPPMAPFAGGNNADAADGKSTAPVRSVRLLVEVAESVQSSPDASVFVYAKATAGPPMPLAVERLRLADLPRMVTLDESMGMMQGMSLANFDQVILVARISSSGIANTSPDDFQATSGVIDVTQANPVIKLLIENRVGDQ